MYAKYNSTTNATITWKNFGEDWSSSFGGEQANRWKLRCVFTWFGVFRRIYTGPIFAIFSPYESSLCTDDVSRNVAMATKIMFIEKWESNEGGLIPPVFFALASENELEYHYLYVRINSSDDLATSDINLVGFWTVPPEFNCVEQVSISDRVSIFTLARWQHGCLASTC